jgi:hypothetical protein
MCALKSIDVRYVKLEFKEFRTNMTKAWQMA